MYTLYKSNSELFSLKETVRVSVIICSMYRNLTVLSKGIHRERGGGGIRVRAFQMSVLVLQYFCFQGERERGGGGKFDFLNIF